MQFLEFVNRDAGGFDMSAIQSIRRRLGDIDGQIRRLQTEREELAAAERVLMRFQEPQGEVSAPAQAFAQPVGGDSPLKDLISLYLGREGPLDRNALGAALKGHRPELSDATLASTLSRLKARGFVTNHQGRWHLVNGHA
jgi:hypothetical protein